VYVLAVETSNTIPVCCRKTPKLSLWVAQWDRAVFPKLSYFCSTMTYNEAATPQKSKKMTTPNKILEKKSHGIADSDLRL